MLLEFKENRQSMGQNTWKGNNGQNILKFGKKQPDKPMFTGL